MTPPVHSPELFDYVDGIDQALDLDIHRPGEHRLRDRTSANRSQRARDRGLPCPSVRRGRSAGDVCLPRAIIGLCGELCPHLLGLPPQATKDIGFVLIGHHFPGTQPDIARAVALQLDGRKVKKPGRKIGPHTLGRMIGSERETAIEAHPWWPRGAIGKHLFVRDASSRGRDFIVAIAHRGCGSPYLGDHSSMRDPSITTGPETPSVPTGVTQEGVGAQIRRWDRNRRKTRSVRSGQRNSTGGIKQSTTAVDRPANIGRRLRCRRRLSPGHLVSTRATKTLLRCALLDHRHSSGLDRPEISREEAPAFDGDRLR